MAQQQQQQSGGAHPQYMGGPQFAEYPPQQPRYGGGVPHAAAYGVLPYGAVPPPAQYHLPPHQHMPGAPDGYQEADSFALAQGMNNMVLVPPGQQQMVQQPGFYYPQQQQQQQQQRMPPAGYGPPVGYGYPGSAPGLRGPPLGPQQQYQQGPGAPQQGGGHMGGPPPMGGMMNGRGGPPGVPGGRMGPGGGPGGPGGPRGGGMGPPGGQQQQQIQRGGGRKKVQRGLEDNVRRTVYISYIDQQVTEESLATFFAGCGTVMDCRICGDPNSAMRFAFIEFMEESGAQEALKMTGSTLGKSSLRVLPSKTAIVPVNKELMPRSEEELERCSRTVYVANIDKKVEREDVRTFFEKLCGRIGKIRLLGDLQHSTRIAFIEFVDAEAAMAALNCSGALLGALPLRVSPSKTPVRGDKDDRESRQNRGGRGRNNNNSNNHGHNNNQQQQQQQEQAQELLEQQQSADAAAPSSPGASPDADAGADEQQQQESDGPQQRTSEAGALAAGAAAAAADAAAPDAAAVAQEAAAPAAADQPAAAAGPDQPAEVSSADGAVAAGLP